MANPTFIKSFKSGGVIPANSMVKFGSVDGTVVAATAATDAIIGVSVLGADASGDIVDVTLGGIEEVKLAGAVTRGDFLTTDAASKAVSASAGNRVVGYAMESGVSGDIIGVFVTPSKI